MAVPDTDTFSLQDVVDEINPVGLSSLQTCFDQSYEWLFDPDYKGGMDRLSNFRNYGLLEPIVSTTLTKGTFTDTFDISSFWYSFTVADSTVTNIMKDISGLTYDKGFLPVFKWWIGPPYLGEWDAYRSLYRFDLTSIPVTAQLKNATLTYTIDTDPTVVYVDLFGIEWEQEPFVEPSPTPHIVKVIGTSGTGTAPFIEGNWAHVSDEELFISKSTYDGDVTSIGSTADRSFIISLFGNYLEICFRSEPDFNESVFFNWGTDAGSGLFFTGAKISNLKLNLEFEFNV